MAKKVFLFFILGLFLFTGCKAKINPENYNKNHTKEITKITDGKIKPNSKIAVQFYEKQIKKDDIGKYVDSDVFVFAPKIKGSAYWKDEKTLVYEPSENLNEKIKYSGILNLTKLFNFETEPKKVGLTFESSGNEVLGSFFWFEPQNKKNDSDIYIFNGYIEFTQAQTIKDVTQSLKLSKGFFSSVKLFITKKNDRVFTIKSEPIIRENYGKDFKFKIKRKKLFLKEDIIEKYRLSPYKTLEINKIEEAGIGEKPTIKISFFELMNPSKDYHDFIKIEPKLDFTVKVVDNYLLVSGDFQNNSKYNITVYGGIESLYGSKIPRDTTEKVDITIGDVKPKVEFSNDGVFLTSAKNKKICIKTINVERVYIEVKKVLEEDIISFVEENGVAKNETNETNYDSYSFKRVGKIVANAVIPINNIKNKWIQSELDLSNLITKNGAHGLYIIQVRFNEEDATYFPDDWDEYQKSDYIYSNGQKIKHIIFSDIGITAKKDSGKLHIFINDILTTNPLKGAIVLSKTKKNVTIDAGDTDTLGMCELKRNGDYIEARYNDQYTLLKLSESELNSSIFDTDGINTMLGIKAFIYSDRGVYRPGEIINISAIVRNNTGSFPDNHPAKLRVYNPKNNLVKEKLNKISKDGFYSFAIPTNSNDFTGEWKFELNVGGAQFTHKIKVEEIVPYTLKVNAVADKKILEKNDKNINFKVDSKYLFGMPSAGLQCINNIKIEPLEVKFPTYRNYIFSNESVDFSPIFSDSLESNLDDNGEAQFSYDLPELKSAPSALNLTIRTKVIEKSGRPVPWQTIIPIKIYNRYVGIEKLENKEFQSGSKVKFKFILVDEFGKAIPNQELEYRVYRAKSYWWWEYDSEDMFRKSYKSDKSVELLDSGKIYSKDIPATYDYNLSDYGELLFEVEDKSSGHTAGVFFGAHWWSGGGKAGKNADITTIKCNKEKYEPGDSAKIYVKTPEKGRALITVEKSGVIISKEWRDITSTNSEFKLDITENMVPNVYFSVSLYQPYQNIKNDMPIRVYATIPIIVEKKNTKLEFDVKTLSEIKPNSNFTVEIQTKDKKEAQFTIAVVDEGLLGITNFETPNPLKYFFMKERMITQTYDTYSDIIGLTWGNISKTYSIGGDGYNLNKETVSKAKRFDPVVFYQAPFMTDKNGNKKLSFKMSNYIGAVRVMVIGARKDSYGTVEKNITVKAPLMVMPSLPRVLGTNDIIEIPVTVFGMQENLGNVNVSLSVNGPVKIFGSNSSVITFDKQGEKDLYFKIKAENKIGTAKIKVIATNGRVYSEKVVEIAVRPYNPSIYITKDIYIAPKSSSIYAVPAEGVIGTGKLKVDFSSKKSLKISNRLKWLIQYPYGCIEQTTSGIFPQLYMKNIFSLSTKEKADIDKNINAGIERLRTFQTQRGGFSYWPGEKEENLWGTNYAGHFLLEAKSRGYFVPDDMIEKWIKFQLENSNKLSDNYKEICYKLYVLALAKKPDISTMNLLKENYISKLDNTDRYLLAGAYKLAGYNNPASLIFRSAKPDVKEYNEFSGNFGSRLRDKSIILDIYTLFKNYNNGLKLFNEISQMVSTDEWYSTQSLGYSLMSLSKYIESTSNKNGEIINATLIVGGTKYSLNSSGKMQSIVINKGFGQNMKIINNSNTPLFAVVNWEAIPPENSIETVSKNLTVNVDWIDEDGQKISPTEIKQGDTFWAHFQVTKPYDYSLDELALVQIIPSGWEIDNTRISGELAPAWAGGLNLGTEQYLDIRDDRIMWFFDMKDSRTSDFLVKINAVTSGEFYLSPTLCEAMYNNNYKSTIKGQYVRVIK